MGGQVRGDLQSERGAGVVALRPRTGHQTATFDALQAALEEAVEALFAQAQTEFDALPDGAREAKPVCSLIRHREGLSVFVHHP